MDSTPGSQNQVWHSDCADASLTFVIPLSNQSPACGPTQIISHSHNHSFIGIFFRHLLSGKQKDSSDPSVEAPLLSLGDMLVMDSRLLHRGLGNRSDRSRPILVLRFDRISHPPPGMGTLGAWLRHAAGHVLYWRLSIFTNTP